MRLLREIAGCACAIALIMAALGFVGNVDYAAELVVEAEEKEARVARAIAIPSTAQIYERPLDLLPLDLPVFCVRYEGVFGMGQEWIRSWGDGAQRPALPTCVKASHGNTEAI